MLSSSVLRPGNLIPSTMLRAPSFAKRLITKEVYILQTKMSALCMLSLVQDYSCMIVHK